MADGELQQQLEGLERSMQWEDGWVHRHPKPVGHPPHQGNEVAKFHVFTSERVLWETEVTV